MSQGFEGPTTGFANDPYEQTIELEPAAEQVLGLSPAFRSLINRRQVRSDFVCSLTLTAAVVGITAAFVWRALDQNSPVPAVTSVAWVASPPPAPAAPPEGAPVQVRNPFDMTEVFEFPAETTKTEAHEAVATLLLKRARERRDQGLGIRHAGDRHPAPVEAERSNQTAQIHTPPDVFVTKLAGNPGSNRL